MKYGCAASGPFVVTVQPLIERCQSSATPSQSAAEEASPFARREVGRRHEARDLGGDRGGREAALLLPALGPERRAVRDQEVRRRLDVVVVERGDP